MEVYRPAFSAFEKEVNAYTLKEGEFMSTTRLTGKITVDFDENKMRRLRNIEELWRGGGSSGKMHCRKPDELLLKIETSD